MTRVPKPGALTAVVMFAAGSLLALAAPSRARAQDFQGAETPQNLENSPPAPVAPDSSANLADFAWLAGRWQGSWGPRLAQQVWLAPHAGVMVGVFQLTENSRTLEVELLTISDTPRGIELRIRHFTPSLTPWEKSGPAVLTLENVSSKSMLFENQASGQPKHWMMKRMDGDTCVAQFEIVPRKGDAQMNEITYRRQKDGAPAHH
jgi:Domain of unknown function (DUF6265)